MEITKIGEQKIQPFMKNSEMLPERAIRVVLNINNNMKLVNYTAPKRYYHLPFFFNLPGLQKRGRNHFPKNSCFVIKDLGILVSQTNLWTNSLIRVQGDCPYILFSCFSKLFCCDGNMF